jgi:high-affinity iron transporter
MAASFLIMFRETLEAALVVGIVLSYLVRTRQTKYRGAVLAGVITGVVASVLGAVAFSRLAGGFTGRAEQVFEGVTMLLGALLLTTMILWMAGQRNVARDLESRIGAEVAGARPWGLFGLVLVSVLREGIEAVIFLGAASFTSAENNLLGALAGLFAALVVGYAMSEGTRKLDVRTFFRVTSLLLVLFAAGLVAHGVHELEEAALLPPIIEHVWDINPPLNADGGYPALHENGQVGSVFKALLGYNGDPSLLEIASYATYLLAVSWLWRRPKQDHKVT